VTGGKHKQFMAAVVGGRILCGWLCGSSAVIAAAEEGVKGSRDNA
jgi:hypothetical protein